MLVNGTDATDLLRVGRVSIDFSKITSTRLWIATSKGSANYERNILPAVYSRQTPFHFTPHLRLGFLLPDLSYALSTAFEHRTTLTTTAIMAEASKR